MEKVKVPRRVQLPSWAGPAILGVAVLGAAVGAGKVLLQFPYGARLSTGPQESHVTVFEEGTRIHFGPDSELYVSFDRRRRLIDARHGKFVFDVAKDTQAPARPFFVATGYAELRALGTEFDVTYLPPNPAVINVSEGVVQVKPKVGIQGNAPINVAAGQSLTLSIDGAATTSDRVKHEGEYFEFSGATVLQMIASFNRFNEKKIHLHDDRTEAAARLPPVSVTLKVTDPEAFVTFLMTKLGWEAAAVVVARPDGFHVCTRPATSCPPVSIGRRGIARAR